jgi:hypothetical protein
MIWLSLLVLMVMNMVLLKDLKEYYHYFVDRILFYYEKKDFYYLPIGCIGI